VSSLSTTDLPPASSPSSPRSLTTTGYVGSAVDPCIHKTDHQALIDGPTTSVPRQQFPYRHLILTPYTISKLPRGAGSGAIKKALEKAGVLEKWESSGWAKKLAARQVRKVRRLRSLLFLRIPLMPELERLRAIPNPTRQEVAPGCRQEGVRQGEEGFGLSLARCTRR